MIEAPEDVGREEGVIAEDVPLQAVISVDEQGRASFQNLQKRSRRSPGQIVYYAFDLLWLNGEDLRMEPLQERKKLLAKIIAKSGVLFSANLEGDPCSIVEQAGKLGLEGIVAKRRTSISDRAFLAPRLGVKFQLRGFSEFDLIPKFPLMRYESQTTSLPERFHPD